MSAAQIPAEKRDVQDCVKKELTAVAQRVLDGVFTPGDEVEIPELIQLVKKNFPDQWPDDVDLRSPDASKVAHTKSMVLADMLRRAADRLTGSFGKLPEYEAALRLFNLSGGISRPDIEPVVIDGVDGKRYSHIRQALLEKAGIDPKAREASVKLDNLRDRLARVLLDPNFLRAPTTALAAASNVLAVRSTYDDVYIPRADYEQKIRELRDSGIKHIWLHGDAGTGKTRLARAANRDIISEAAVPILPVANTVQFERQLAELLVRYGVKPESINSTNLWPLFFGQLRRGALPEVIVLEDVPDDDIHDLIALDTKPLLIFTSIRLPPSTYHGYRIEVGELEMDEAVNMVRSRLPSLDDSSIYEIVQTLGGRPLAIEHSCAYLRETGMPVTTYCQAVNNAPDRVLDAAGDRHGRTLTRIYQLAVEALANSSDSLRALDYLIFTWPDSMSFDMMAQMWTDSLKYRGNSPVVLMTPDSADFMSFLRIMSAPGVAYFGDTYPTYIPPESLITLHAAIRRLEDFGLVRSSGPVISIHQLTRRILSSLRESHRAAVYERIRTIVSELLEIDLWKADEPVPVARALWGPQVSDALAYLGNLAPDDLRNLSDSEVIQLATLLTFTLRSFRQIGLSIDNLLHTTRYITALIGVRATHPSFAAERRQVVLDTFYDLERMFIEIRVGKSGFDRSSDGQFPFVREPIPALVRLAIQVRLHHDTEWQLAHHIGALNEKHLVDLNSSTAVLNASQQGYMRRQGRIDTRADSSRVDRYKLFARSSIAASTIYYDSCRWQDAIAAVEHAYSCYMKIGADIECTRGIMDAARRLAKVNLRAGYLNDAALWLLRAQWMFKERSEARVNGMPSRYRLRDRVLEVQLNQVQTQLELTNEIIRFEQDESDDAAAKFQSFCKDPYAMSNGGLSAKSRLEEAEEAVQLFIRIGERRLAPEAHMHAFRLRGLSGELMSPNYLSGLQRWFDKDGLAYQLDLLGCQIETFSVPVIADLVTNFDGEELDAFLEKLPEEAGQLLHFKLKNRKRYSRLFYQNVRKMRDEHLNWYWYARGLCALHLVAQTADLPKDWIDGLRSELEYAALHIGREDWIEWTYAYNQTNEGLWLLGY